MAKGIDELTGHREHVAWLDDVRDSIRWHVAHTLYVEGVATAHDDPDSGYDAGDMVAGPGEDWFDTVGDLLDAPADVFDAAAHAADRIVTDFEERNGRHIGDAFEIWSELPRYGNPERGPAEFAFGLAMSYLGHGVGLFDDVQGPERPYFETGYAESLAVRYL